MPPRLQKIMEELAEKFVHAKICFGGLEYSLSGNTAKECRLAYLEGATKAVTERDKELLESAPEFDEEAFHDWLKAFKASSGPGLWHEEGARWQFDQLRLKLAARDARVSTDRETIEHQNKTIDRLEKELASLRAEVTDLRVVQSAFSEIDKDITVKDALLRESLQYLKEGKAKFAPHTTNSLVDDLIKKLTAHLENKDAN